MEANTNASRLRATWLKPILKKYGDTSVKEGGELEPPEYRSSGSLALDVALGGGWIKSSIVQLTGPEGGGKTLLFDMAAVETQRTEKKRALIFDFEGTYSIERFKALGGDPELLDYIGHDSIDPMLFADTAFDIAKDILLEKNSNYGVVCFDSTGAMMTIREFEKRMEKGDEADTPFLTAKAIARGIGILIGMVKNNPSKPTVFFVSQGRDNVNAASFKGPPQDKQTGGRALPYFASTIVDVRKGDRFKADDELGREAEVGSVTRVRVRKNKGNGNQGRIAEFDVYYAGEVRGLDRISELAKLAVYSKVISRSGAWYNYGDLKWQGLEAVKDALEDDALFDAIKIKTQAALDKMMEITNADTESEGE